MAKATYDDVNLILKLYDIRREDKMRAARAWFFANFKPKSMAEFQQLCPPGSEPNAYARQVSSYWDMAASFITAGVLNDELFFQNSRELLFVWLRVEPIKRKSSPETGSAPGSFIRGRSGSNRASSMRPHMPVETRSDRKSVV